jgi:cell division protein FtsB
MTGGQGTHAAERRHRQADFLRHAIRAVLVLIAAVILLIAGVTFYPEWTRLQEMKRDLSEKTAKLEEAGRIGKEREMEIHLLQTDPKYLETIARDRLDLMKPGETIFRLSTNNPHKS